MASKNQSCGVCLSIVLCNMSATARVCLEKLDIGSFAFQHSKIQDVFRANYFYFDRERSIGRRRRDHPTDDKRLSDVRAGRRRRALHPWSDGRGDRRDRLPGGSSHCRSRNPGYRV